jgi:hypothetical protein
MKNKKNSRDVKSVVKNNEQKQVGYGDKKLEGPNRPAE